MQVICIFVAIVALALGAPAPQQGPTAQIVRFDNENIGVDGYKFSFETSDPIKREETGELTNPGTDDESMVVRGEYTFVLPDGKTQIVTFVADKNGYRPSTKTS